MKGQLNNSGLQSRYCMLVSWSDKASSGNDRGALRVIFLGCPSSKWLGYKIIFPRPFGKFTISVYAIWPHPGEIPSELSSTIFVKPRHGQILNRVTWHIFQKCNLALFLNIETSRRAFLHVIFFSLSEYFYWESFWNFRIKTTIYWYLWINIGRKIFDMAKSRIFRLLWKFSWGSPNNFINRKALCIFFN